MHVRSFMGTRLAVPTLESSPRLVLLAHCAWLLMTWLSQKNYLGFCMCSSHGNTKEEKQSGAKDRQKLCSHISGSQNTGFTVNFWWLVWSVPSCIFHIYSSVMSGHVITLHTLVCIILLHSTYIELYYVIVCYVVLWYVIFLLYHSFGGNAFY